MKITKELIAIGLLGLFPTTMVWAAQVTVSDEPEAAAPEAAAPEAATNQEAAESPSDAEVTNTVPAPQKDDACGADIACDGKAGACFDPCGKGSKIGGGLDVGGWVQAGYHTEGTNGNGTGMFNDYANVIQLQQFWLYAEKAADTQGCGWDWGFRADYVYGTDGQDTQAFGNRAGQWDEGWDNGGAYGHAIPQLYADIAYNDLTVRVGHFYTIIGYEVVPAPGNFFYSHSFSLSYEPFTHTGFLAEWEYSDRLTLYGGWIQGWDTGFSNNGGDGFLLGFKYQLTDSMSLAYAATTGDFGFGAGSSDSNGYEHSFVIDWNVTDRLNYVLQTDYVDNDLFTTGVLGTAGPYLTVNQYLLYEVNDCWAFGGRFEWVNFEGPSADFTQVTIGANYRPRPNLTIRPEVRVEQFDPAVGRRDQTLFGVDAILTF